MIISRISGMFDLQVPSQELKVLYESGWLMTHLPALHNVWEVPQDPKHHPEGCVGNHICEVLDRARLLKIFVSDPTVYMWAALLHDVGKVSHTFWRGTTGKDLTFYKDREMMEGERIVSYGHEYSGAKIAEETLLDIGANYIFAEEVGKIVSFHMRPLMCEKAKSVKKAKEAGCPMEITGYLAWADKGKKPELWLNNL